MAYKIDQKERIYILGPRAALNSALQIIEESLTRANAGGVFFLRKGGLNEDRHILVGKPELLFPACLGQEGVFSDLQTSSWQRALLYLGLTL